MPTADAPVTPAAMPPPLQVFLVPGFFGFTSFGEFRYFGHVRDELTAAFATLGRAAVIRDVQTLPTASLTRRAALLMETVRSAARTGPFHLVGHSTGGLDARLAATPGARLPGVADLSLLAARICSVTTVSTPHRGTPLASFFHTLYGQHLLRLLSLGAVVAIRQGRVPTMLLARLAMLVNLPGDLAGRDPDTLDQLYRQLLRDYDSTRQDALDRFLTQVVEDQSLMNQLSPDVMELFDALCPDRPGVRYASVVTMSARPHWRSIPDAGLRVADQASRAVYTRLHLLAARAGRGGSQAGEALALVGQAPGANPQDAPTADRSDGIVPTWSQPYGRLLRVARADHLDVIGHFRAPRQSSPHYDWLFSGSGFGLADFKRVWADVARFILDSEADR